MPTARAVPAEPELLTVPQLQPQPQPQPQQIMPPPAIAPAPAPAQPADRTPANALADLDAPPPTVARTDTQAAPEARKPRAQPGPRRDTSAPAPAAAEVAPAPVPTVFVPSIKVDVPVGADGKPRDFEAELADITAQYDAGNLELPDFLAQTRAIQVRRERPAPFLLGERP